MSDDVLLQMHDIRKSFGATRALRGVSLSVRRGQVLALIGENGAGKSTLMKVLSGAHRPDDGHMTLSGRPFQPVHPHDARAAGVAMIYQELNLAPDLTVEDNVMLGQELNVGGLVARRRQRQQVRQVLEQLGHPELNPQAIVGRLSVGAQQLVEIARALVFNARVIVFDEPTSSLPRHDAQRLFALIGRLKEAGHGIVYISHFLEEIREVADHFAVLRDGESVAGGSLEEVTDAQIVSLMAGRNVEELFPAVPHQAGRELLSLRDLCGQRMPEQVDLSVRSGEILGIAGLVGAGRTELLRAIFGLDPVRRGHVQVRGFTSSPTPRQRTAAGLGMVSEDRKGEGLAQSMSVADNATLNRLDPYTRFGWLNLGLRRRKVSAWVERLNIKTAGVGQPVQTLSGGNQQKVALARVLHQDADVLLLDEPARGIDVATKAEIYRLIGELAAAGKAVIFVSSYLPELLAICDRIGVMVRGRLETIRPVSQWTEEAVLAAAVGTELDSGMERPELE